MSCDLHHRLGVLVLLALLALAPACGDASGSGAADAATDTILDTSPGDLDTADDVPESDGPYTALFGLGPDGDAPFPFDLFTVADPTTTTGRRLHLEARNSFLVDRGLDNGIIDAALLRDILNDLDGFSTFAPILIGTSGPVDATTLPAAAADSTAPASTVVLLDAEPGSPTLGQRVAIDVRAESFPYPGGRVYAIHGTPIRPLAPAHRYAFVVTREVHGADGQPLLRHPDFEAAAGLAPPPEGYPHADALARATAALAPLPAALDAAGMALDDVAAATVFTTQDTQRVGLALRDAVDTSTLPLDLVLDADGDGVVDTFELATLPNAPANLPDMTGVGPIVVGTFQAPDYRGASGELALDADGKPVQHGTLTLPFILTLPAAPAALPCPVVVLQHGRDARKETTLYATGHLARAGLAVIAIDHLAHGALADTGNFADITDPARVRGTFLQTIPNQLRLFRAVQSLEVDLLPLGAPDGQSDLAVPGPIGFVGESLGGITGLISVGMDADVEVAVLNVTGGGIRHVLGLIVTVLFPNLWTRLQVTVLLQTLSDAFDPINFADRLVREPLDGRTPPDVLMQAIVDDATVPPAATEALADTLPVPLVCPCPPGHGITRLVQTEAPQTSLGMFYFGDARHGDLLAGQLHPEASDAMRRQLTRFLASYFHDGVGRIEDPALLAP